MKSIIVHIDPSLTANTATISTRQFDSFGFEHFKIAVLKIVVEQKSHFLHVRRDKFIENDRKVSIGPDYARAISVNPGDILQAERYMSMEEASIVFAVPATVSDYEIIEANQQLLESIFLQKVSIVYAGIKLYMQLHSTLGIHLEIQRIGDASDSDKCYNVRDGTHLAIETKARKKPGASAAVVSNLNLQQPAYVAKMIEWISSLSPKVVPNTIFVSGELARTHGWDKGITLAIVPLETLCALCISCIAKDSPNLLHEVGGVQSSPAVLRAAVRSEVAILPDEFYGDMLNEYPDSDVSNFFFANNFEPGTPVFVFSIPEQSKASETAIAARTWAAIMKNPTVQCVENASGKPFLKSFDFVEACKELRNRNYRGLNSVLLGSRGTGKTTVLRYIHRVVPSVYVDCTFTNLSVSERIARLQSAFMTCAITPSVLLIDNFDELFGRKSRGQHTQGDENTVQLALAVRCLFDMQSAPTSSFTVIVSRRLPTVELPAPLQRSFINFFPLSVTLRTLTVKESTDLLLKMVCELQPYADAVGRITEAKLSSFTANDICSFVEILRWSIKRSPSNILNCLSSALSTFQPAAHEGLPLSLVTKISDGIDEAVVGMRNAKKRLREVILLPLQNPADFAQLPIKLSRGVLLYGPTGCGKTYLAKKFIEVYNLRCIYVNGPEMLQKYVGSSEEKVRELFQQAGQISPAIIFIDELEACVPQRGSDHSGVTDRVVNQFLCELDGVETASEVYVIAATSRPEIIDKAMLRPGRLDTSLYCAPPDSSERVAAIAQFSQSELYSFESAVDAEAYAQKMDGWSYADIRASFDRALDETLAMHLEAATAEEPTIENTFIHESIVLSSGGLSEEEVRAKVGQYARLLPSKTNEEEERPDRPKISLAVFDDIVRSMEPSMKSSDLQRYADFGTRGTKVNILKQRTAIL